ncbi:MAG: PASTA domain-containing protein [Cytophagaceae bacterium]|nr:PASTA domain-containing protein [Cytophagaceae bacterium]MDW8456290.1 PASTA domain-containing protein [Cytophagaceae bacterium]
MFLKANTPKDVLIHFLLMIAISVVLLILFFYVYLPIATKHGEAIKVPDLKGKTITQAEEELKKLNLRYHINDSTYVEGAIPHSVLLQHPAAGSDVKSNRKIYITIASKNPPTVQMPALVDNSLKQAEITLKSHGLVLGTVRQVPSQFVNLVIRQYAFGKEVAPGTPLPKGTKIDLDVGDGNETTEIELPNFVGLSLDDARALISENGLTEGLVKKEQVPGKKSQEVIRQKPEYKQGKKIKTGEVINLWYAE